MSAKADGEGQGAANPTRLIHIPLTRSAQTFKEIHMQRIDETEASMIQQVKSKRGVWEKEVDQMGEELLKLHASYSEDADRVSNASDRSDSSDSFDTKRHDSYYFDCPDTGKRRFQLRFKIKDFKQDSIKMSVDNGRIKITAIKVEKRSNGKDREVRYTKRVKKPSRVRPEDLVSKLSSDGILVIEAPLRPKQRAHREAYSCVPMEHTSLTFQSSQQKRMDQDQQYLVKEVKKRKEKYEKEVTWMQEEFLQLYLSGSHPNHDPLVIHRAGSVDIMDDTKMKTLYYESPETGLKSLRLRFDVRNFDLSSIRIKIESEAIVVRASKDEKNAEGEKERLEYIRKVKVPPDVDVVRVKSNLTKDGILDVQVPVMEFPVTGTEDDLKTPTNGELKTPTNGDGALADDHIGDEEEEDDDEEEVITPENNDDYYSKERRTGEEISRDIPLSHDELTFGGIHNNIAQEMEGKLTRDVQKKRINWEEDVKQMHIEFLKLYPANKDWGSDDFLQDPLIKKRTGSTDILNTDEMKSLYLTNEETGKAMVKLRFDVKDYDKSSITVTKESDRLVVSASRGEDEAQENCKENFVRKIQIPKDIDTSNFTSFLTKDGILTVEAPRKGKSRAAPPLRSPHPSPLHSSQKSPIHSSMSAYSFGSSSDKNSPPKLPKPNMPVFNKINGVKHLILVVPIGNEFDPRDVTVQANSASCLNVKAKHTEITKERYSKFKFERDYELPEKIVTTSLKAGLRTDGHLIIAAIGKGEDAMSQSISLKSLNLGNWDPIYTESE